MWADLPRKTEAFIGAMGLFLYSDENIAAAAQQAPQLIKVENSGILSAGLVNHKGLASGSCDATQYNEAFDQLNYGFCVLAVKCTYVEDNTVYGYQEGNVRNIGEVSYTADFEEFLVLALCGGMLGFACGYIAEGLLLKAVLCALGIVGVHLIGAAVAVLRICNVNVMRLMKGDNEV